MGNQFLYLMVTLSLSGISLTILNIFHLEAGKNRHLSAFLLTLLAALAMTVFYMERLDVVKSNSASTILVTTEAAGSLPDESMYRIEEEHLLTSAVYFDYDNDATFAFHFEPAKKEEEGGPKWCKEGDSSCLPRAGVLMSSVRFYGFSNGDPIVCDDTGRSTDSLISEDLDAIQRVLTLSERHLDRPRLYDFAESSEMMSGSGHEVSLVSKASPRKSESLLRWTPKGWGNWINDPEKKGETHWQRTCKIPRAVLLDEEGATLSDWILPPAHVVQVPRVLFTGNEGKISLQRGIQPLVSVFADLEREFESIPAFDEAENSHYYRGQVRDFKSTEDDVSFYYTDRPSFVVYPKLYHEMRGIFLWLIGLIFSLVVFNLREYAASYKSSVRRHNARNS